MPKSNLAENSVHSEYGWGAVGGFVQTGQGVHEPGELALQEVEAMWVIFVSQTGPQTSSGNNFASDCLPPSGKQVLESRL